MPTTPVDPAGVSRPCDLTPDCGGRLYVIVFPGRQMVACEVCGRQRPRKAMAAAPYVPAAEAATDVEAPQPTPADEPPQPTPAPQKKTRKAKPPRSAR